MVICLKAKRQEISVLDQIKTQIQRHNFLEVFLNKPLLEMIQMDQNPDSNLGAGGGWRRWLSGGVSVCLQRLRRRTEQQQSSPDTLSDPEEHTGMMMDLTLYLTVELFSDQFRLQH